jgi:hypothetical protein
MKKILIILLAMFIAIMFVACPTPMPKVATPTFDPVEGQVDLDTEITIATTTEGATIYYTTNGDDPTTESTEYSDTAKPTITATTTVKAIAVKAEMENSAIASAIYTIAPEGHALTLTIVGDGTVGVTDDGNALTGTGPWDIEEGSTVVLTATAGSDPFILWTGDISSTDNPYTINSFDADTAVTAVFGSATTEDFESSEWNGYNPEIPWYNGVILDDDGGYLIQSNIAPFSQGTTVNAGSSALQFGQTSDDTSEVWRLTRSFLAVKINAPANATVSFYYKVSCADQVTNFDDSDGFRFYENGNFTTADGTTNEEPTLFAAGDVDWVQYTHTFTAAGEYTVAFGYFNEPGVTPALDDTAWLDDITFSAGVIFVDPDPALFNAFYGESELTSGDSVDAYIAEAGSSSLSLQIDNVFVYPDLPEANLLLTGSPLVALGGDLGTEFSVTSAPEVIIGTSYIELEVTNPSTDGTLTISIPYSLDYGATTDTFTLTFNITRVPVATTPESFEGADFDNLTSGNTVILEGDTLPTLSTTEAFEGTQSLYFFGAISGDDETGQISLLVDVAVDDVLTFYYKRLDGSTSTGYSIINVKANGTSIGNTIQGCGSTPDPDFIKWQSNPFTEAGLQMITIQFAQSSGSNDMEVYLDYLNVAPPTPEMTVTYDSGEVPSDGSTYSMPAVVGSGVEFFFTVKCPNSSLVALNITNFDYDFAGTGDAEVTNTTPLSTGTLNPGESANIGFTITADLSFTSGLIEIDNNSDVASWEFAFTGLSVSPPDPPTAVSAAAGSGMGEIVVSWTEPATLPSEGYNIYRSETSGGPYSKINFEIIPTGTTTYDDFLLTGYTYYYVMTSVNDVTGDLVESGYSTESTGYVTDAALFAETFEGDGTWANLTSGHTWNIVNNGGTEAWIILDPANPPESGHGENGDNLTGTFYAFIDSDGAGSGHTQDTEMQTPPIILTGSETTLSFDHYYYYWSYNDVAAEVLVFDGSDWIVLHDYKGDAVSVGGWGAPERAQLDISSYSNTDFQVSFYYKSSFGYHWAVDNVYVY